MDTILTLIGIFVAINSLTNVFYLFIFTGLNRRIERIENIFLRDIENLLIKNNKKD